MPFGQEIFRRSGSLRWGKARAWGPALVEVWAWGAEEGVEWGREEGQAWAGDAVEDVVPGVVETVGVFSVLLSSRPAGKMKGFGCSCQQTEQFVP